jgi:hypothetical protein
MRRSSAFGGHVAFFVVAQQIRRGLIWNSHGKW